MLNEEDIKLYPHNEKAYQALSKSLSQTPLAFIEHATGTGKSMILLKYLYLKMRQKRILFISMHDEMFGQLFNDQMPTLGMKKSDFLKFDTLIYPNILRTNPEDLIKEYDCFVFDEAHHCGALKWGEKVLKLRDLVLKTPDKKMIGATATGTRYLDNYMDVSEVYFGGNTVSRLSIITAILNNLLPAPLYINTLISCLDYLKKVEKKLSRVSKIPQIIAYQKEIDEIRKKILEESDIASLLVKYGLKPGEKYIVFCKDKKDLDEKQKSAAKWFENIGSIKTFAAHSYQSKQINIQEIEEFSHPRKEISLMFAIDIFNEGFHIDGVDGILMFRKTKSPIVYFQQLGRALSFSVRKKQIKIFDFANNIAYNEIIYNLYKELLAEVKKLISENPENKDLYLQILERFKIIDETTNIIDRLKQIDKDLDENYIMKDLLDSAILKLKEYRTFYPSTNFREELYNKRLDFSYVRAFKYICDMSDNLTIEQIKFLQSLNIDFNEDINLDIDIRLKKLKGCKTFKDLHNKEDISFIEEYISFCQVNVRRPNINGSKSEKNLYIRYRTFIQNNSKLRRLSKKYTFPLSIEEKILLGDYPLNTEIDSYVQEIEDKISKGERLDPIELKVLRKLKNFLAIKSKKVLDYVNSHEDVNYKLERAIETIAYYKNNINPDERFENPIMIIGYQEVYKAYIFICKNAKKINNSQFEKLLSLNIKLPHVIDMSLKKRLELLKGYNSFYELELALNKDITEEYIDFVKENKRRPNILNEDERNLCLKYKEFLSNSTVFKIRKVCQTLKYFGIKLTLYERAIIGDKIESSLIEAYVKEIEHKLLNNKIVSEENLKILRALERYNSDSTEIDIDYYIKQASIISKLYSLVEKLKELEKDNIDSNFKTFKIFREIRENFKFITKDLLDKLLELNVNLPDSLVREINSLNGELNIASREYKSLNSFLKRFKEVLRSTKKRPPSNSPLDIEYRNYLAKLPYKKVQDFIDLLASFNIKPTFEENVLINFIDYEQIDAYNAHIEHKIKNELEIDALERRVYTKIRKSKALNNKIRVKKDLSFFDIEERLVETLKLSIIANPTLPIDYNNSLYRVSISNQKKLEQFRLNLLSKKIFNLVIRKLKETKKPLEDCLNEDLRISFEECANSTNLDVEGQFLLSEIKRINIDNKFLSRGLERKAFIDAYILFIRTFGHTPSMVSTDENELKLALDFDFMKKTLTIKELSQIEKAINRATSSYEKENFYDQFINFIITNGRFPCGNSIDPQEVRLNSLYLSLNENFTKEQGEEVTRLKKTYRKATLEANLRFSKIN